MSTSNGLLIIGASQAGVQLAVSLRALGYDEPITLLGEENHRPYQRPALSKEFLQDKVSKESLIFRTADYWAEHRIEVVANERILRIDKQADGSGAAYAMSGRRFDFDRLALTVGARARRLLLEGMDLPGVLYLRNADDALELKARVPDVKDVVVVGGGFIGAEAAASLRAMGRNVVLLEAGPRLLGRAVGEETATEVLRRHREAGIEIVTGARIKRATARGDKVGGVELEDGTVYPADLVLVGVGVVPNTELAESIGLHCDNGIVVDRQAVASDGVTIAVGDVANLPNPLSEDDADRIRFESVNNAVEQGKVAAYAITGRAEEYAGIPWFWSNQGEMKIQIAGLSAGHDRTVVRRDEEKGKFSVLYYRRERLIACDAINTPLDFMAVKAALSNGQHIPASAAADPAVMLKKVTQ
ncbi:NAD(P)/FAD-dependent oxidoreductase [Nocardioides sp. NPDC057767]|uniref:NAD(P)/FAD-dependent oxidoreductase n=1 Tax=unclassified Nocardioides TaxID=2615069 RepID=UPI00366EF116